MPKKTIHPKDYYAFHCSWANAVFFTDVMNTVP